MAPIIAWLIIGVIVFFFLHDFPASPETADKTQWKIKHVWQRVLIRLSMLMLGPVWIIATICVAVGYACVWLTKVLYRSIVK